MTDQGMAERPRTFRSGCFLGTRSSVLIQQFISSEPRKRGHMERTITDEDGRVWLCRPENKRTPAAGRDVILLCTTPSVPTPLRLTVGWGWLKMAEKGLARLIDAATR